MLDNSEKIYYIANARMPTEKAHGIQIAKMCEALIEAGADLTLVVTNRITEQHSLRDYYGLRVDIPTVRLPVLDFYTRGRVGYRIASYSFALSYLVFILWRRLRGEHFILYTVDLDNFSSSLLALTNTVLFTEMHGGKPDTVEQCLLFRALQGVIPINRIIADELQKKFPLSRAKYLVEPNGIDESIFYPRNKAEARKRLGIPQEEKMLLYSGRMFGWKGLEIVPQAAVLCPEVIWRIVGGTKKEYENVVDISPPANLLFMGSQPYEDMSWWLAAADVVLVLGTKRDQQSYYYTSPMKLFEYLTAERPIIAADTPALREIVSEEEVLFYTPDDAHDLAEKVQYTLSSAAEVNICVVNASKKSLIYTWKGRGERVLAFIKQTINDINL